MTLSAAFLVATAMVLGTGISIWQAARARDESEQKDYALADAVAARGEADVARRDVEEFAERLKQANLLLSSGRAHADAGRWSAANVDYTRATELQPNYYNVWVERGSLYRRLGLWQLAADDYAKAFLLGAPTDGPSWWGIAPLFVYTGRDQLAHALGKQTVGDKSVDELSLLDIRTCLIVSGQLDPMELAAQAERQLSVIWRRPDEAIGGRRERRDHKGPPRGRGRGSFGGPELAGRQPGSPGQGPPGIGFMFPGGAAVGLYVTGWAHLNAQQYDQAIDRLNESLEPWRSGPGGSGPLGDGFLPRPPSGDDSGDRPANDRSARGRPQGGGPAGHGGPAGERGYQIAYPLLAMAYQRNGQGDEALAALTKAQQFIDQQIASVDPESLGWMPAPWFDLIECLVLYRQAHVLVKGSVPPDDPRLRTIQRQVLEGLQNVSAE